MAVSFICGGIRRKPPTRRKSLTNFITECCIEYISPWEGFELTTLVVIDTDCTGSCKSNYHKTTTTTTPLYYFMIVNKIFILFDKTWYSFRPFFSFFSFFLYTKLYTFRLELWLAIQHLTRKAESPNGTWESRRKWRKL